MLPSFDPQQIKQVLETTQVWACMYGFPTSFSYVSLLLEGGTPHTTRRSVQIIVRAMIYRSLLTLARLVLLLGEEGEDIASSQLPGGDC